MSQKQRWTPDSLPWHKLRPERVRDNEPLFHMVSTASFIEITSDLYTSNLVEHFAGDDEMRTWLLQSWEPEEVNHGRALREYTMRVWPDFDWEVQYAKFFKDYSALCTPDQLLPQRSLELVARCVVEMGTATYYTAMQRISDEPVLVQLAHNIYQDEVRHYKYFYKYFRRYREIENTGRAQVLGALWHRLKELEDEDSYLALKHVHCFLHPGEPYNHAVYKELMSGIRKLAGPHFPHELSVNMLLKPLDMAPIMRRVVQPVAEGVARFVVAA